MQMNIEFNIVPKDKKLLKSSKVRKYLAIVEDEIRKSLDEQNAGEKIVLAYMLGQNVSVDSNGKISIGEEITR
jgi:hypothetical protein